MKIVTKSGQLIDEISEFLADDLESVNRHIQSILDSETKLVSEVGHYVCSAHGKRLRPMMVLLASRACGHSGEDQTHIAAALEIIHTATLLHDDVIDKAPLRRGRATVNAHWGDDVAILIADYFYASAFKMAMMSLNPIVLSVICDVTAKMCEGEMFQIEKGESLLAREDYLRIIRCKTAGLFSACTGLGGVLAKAGEMETLELTKFGMNFGIAFQITDDALDIMARGEELGKETCTDIRNGKQTLPLIRAMEVAEAADREDLWSCWNNGRDSQRILTHIRKYQGIEFALQQARSYAEKAKGHLAILKPSRAAELCAQLTDYVAERNY